MANNRKPEYRNNTGNGVWAFVRRLGIYSHLILRHTLFSPPPNLNFTHIVWYYCHVSLIRVLSRKRQGLSTKAEMESQEVAEEIRYIQVRVHRSHSVLLSRRTKRRVTPKTPVLRSAPNATLSTQWLQDWQLARPAENQKSPVITSDQHVPDVQVMTVQASASTEPLPSRGKGPRVPPHPCSHLPGTYNILPF